MLGSAPAESPTEPRLHIAMPFQGRWIRKVFVGGLGVPRHQVYRVLRGIKICLMPRQVRRRRLWAENLTAAQSDLGSWRRSGHRALLPQEVGDLEPILSVCRKIQHDSLEAVDSKARKEFLRVVASDQDFLAHPAVIGFVLSEPILRAVSAYLGTVPILAGVTLRWSPPDLDTTNLSASQRFHNDHEDVSQVKLFVHVDDIDPDHGVFTFYPADTTRRIRKALGTRRGRLDDVEVARIVGEEPPETLVGRAGSASFVDTSRCLHFGSRPSPKGRLILTAQYLRCHSPTHSKLALTLNSASAAAPWTPLQRMVLGLRDATSASARWRT